MAYKITDKCNGCDDCAQLCPVRAISGEMKEQHEIDPNRCIDCGSCYKECPHHAIFVKQDDFDEIFKFKCRVALIPAVFLGQFPNDISVSRIYNILKDLGFTHVIETEITSQFYTEAKNQLASVSDNTPLISSFCPAIVRLIQVKFPGLVDNLIPLKAPIDLTAMYIRKKLQEQGFSPDEIGIFYITPCAAKIAAVKSPVGEEKSNVNGVINMDSLYNRVFKKIKEQGHSYEEESSPIEQLSADNILISLTNGERRLSESKHSLSIDEISNVIEFLEKVENDEVDGIDFLELRACDQSCSGGILTCNNRFLTCEKMFSRARAVAQKERSGEITRAKEVEEEKDYIMSNIRLDKIEPRSMLSLDTDIAKALEKMNKINEYKRRLPQIDCAICGAPSCDALANDIVCNNRHITDCIFIQRGLEAKKELNVEESVNIMEEIWGDDRIMNINKNK